jgi:uncharacterized protein (TIGR00106 family)
MRLTIPKPKNTCFVLSIHTRFGRDSAPRPKESLFAKDRQMLAEFSVFPLDKGMDGLSKYVAESMKIIADSGLDYEVHAMGTLIEGSADEVFSVIRTCHDNMLRHGNRVITTVKIDDRKGAAGRIKGKVKSVEDKLGRELPKG